MSNLTNLAYLKLKRLPDNIPQIVSDNFCCDHNHLTSLKGSPTVVKAGFFCSYNVLRSLSGSPKHVYGGFYCAHNNLTSLEGLPQSIGGVFSCDDYLLKDKENRYIIIGSLIRGRFKKYEGKELYNICLNVIEEYL